MEHETDLVGERRRATGASGGELRLMQLDQILGLAARAIQAVVDPLGRADIEAGDDEADVETEHRRLNTGDGAPCGGSRYSRAEQSGSRWRVACGCRRRPRRLFWREAWYRKDQRCSRCRCSRTTSSPPAEHSARPHGT